MQVMYSNEEIIKLRKANVVSEQGLVEQDIRTTHQQEVTIILLLLIASCILYIHTVRGHYRN